MLRYIDYICALIVRSLNLIFHFLPTRFALFVGRQLGGVVCLINTPRRIVAYANLRAAFSKEKTPQELKRLTKKVYKSLAEIFSEVLTLTKVDEKYVNKYVDIVNSENMLKIKGYKSGIILLTAHFGNWELSAVASAVKGFPPLVLVRNQKMKKLYELMIRLRESKGIKIVRKGISTKYVIKALRKGEIIAMLSDQDAGKTGEFIDFFGRPASVAPGAARIAQKTGAYILPAFIARTNGPYHRLVLEDPVKIEKKEDIRPYLEKYNMLLEKYVRMYPEQWLWVHKRWKSSPVKKVAILSDGKPGHLNQALALFNLLKRYREDSGYSADDTKAEIIEIKFKNKFAKNLVNFLSLFSTSACQGCMKCLRSSLKKESYDALTSTYSNIVIGSGSLVAGVNRIFSIENNAKSVHAMKPSILGFKKFDMVVIPSHDGKDSGDGRVITTDTTLNLIDDEYMASSGDAISALVKPEPKRRIGVLLGGDNSDFMLTEGITRELLSGVVDAAEKLDAELLFTTARRTPELSEKIVKEKLENEKRCKLLVIANEKNISNVVGGILDLSDVVVVSGESASMVSEAVMSGKKIVVLRLKKKKRASKFERMLKHLENKGFVTTVDTGGLSEAISKSFDSREIRRLPEDRFNVYKYMWRLL